MTRKEMITYCVEDQIRRGVVKAENKALQINSRLNGWNRMSVSACRDWYEATKAAEAE